MSRFQYLNGHEGRAVEYLRCQLDPNYFIANYCYIMSMGNMVRPSMYDFRCELVDAINHSTTIVAVGAHQIGNTTLISLYLLWYALFNDHATVYIASTNNAEAREIMAKIKATIGELPEWLLPAYHHCQQHFVELDNNSRIFAYGSTSLNYRGQGISVMHVDNAAFASPELMEIIPYYVGKAIISGSLYRAGDPLHRAWLKTQTHPEPGCIGIKQAWGVNPEWSLEQMAEIYTRIGPKEFKIEYDCELPE